MFLFGARQALSNADAKAADPLAGLDVDAVPSSSSGPEDELDELWLGDYDSDTEEDRCATARFISPLLSLVPCPEISPLPHTHTHTHIRAHTHLPVTGWTQRRQ
jgi:hypothetical protein